MTKTTKTKTARKKTTTPAGASVVPADFRARYAEHGGSCGDALANKLRKHVATKDGSVDLAKLRKLAEANDAWRSNYAALNPGLARMTVGNRLRKLVRDGGKVVWR